MGDYESAPAKRVVDLRALYLKLFSAYPTWSAAALGVFALDAGFDLQEASDALDLLKTSGEVEFFGVPGRYRRSGPSVKEQTETDDLRKKVRDLADSRASWMKEASKREDELYHFRGAVRSFLSAFVGDVDAASRLHDEIMRAAADHRPGDD